MTGNNEVGRNLPQDHLPAPVSMPIRLLLLLVTILTVFVFLPYLLGYVIAPIDPSAPTFEETELGGLALRVLTVKPTAGQLCIQLQMRYDHKYGNFVLESPFRLCVVLYDHHGGWTTEILCPVDLPKSLLERGTERGVVTARVPVHPDAVAFSVCAGRLKTRPIAIPPVR
jgi:hypothetical protein